MPYCKIGRSIADGSKGLTESSKDEESCSIFYQRYGHGPTKVLLIIGLAGNHQSWGPQVKGLCGTDVPNEEEGGEDVVVENRNGGGDDECSESHETLFSEEDGFLSSSVNESSDWENGNAREDTGNGIEVCTFDNRGVGKSFIPKHRSNYTTKTMAVDVLELLDHLGWEKTHVCGHSMGGMIACKLAAIAPHRLSSLTLIGVTGGGYQCLPKFNRKSFSILYRIYRAKTPEERSAVDLETHYTEDYLEATVGETNRRALLFKEYVKNLLHGGMQPRYGLEGQASACWNHSLSSDEIATIQSAGIIVALVHGRGDVIAQVEHARNLTKKLHPVSRMIELHGGHLVMHQNTEEVNAILLGVIRAVRMNVKCTEFKASDAGLYEGGDYWQTEDTRSQGVEQKQGGAVALPSPMSASESVVSAFWRKVLPDLIDLFDIFPFLHRVSKLVGIDRLWKKVSVYYD
ncbi:unnamed protein product [Calypogeia fissa]